jgi:hypothetical protein
MNCEREVEGASQPHRAVHGNGIYNAKKTGFRNLIKIALQLQVSGISDPIRHAMLGSCCLVRFHYPVSSLCIHKLQTNDGAGSYNTNDETTRNDINYWNSPQRQMSSSEANAECYTNLAWLDCLPSQFSPLICHTPST